MKAWISIVSAVLAGCTLLGCLHSPGASVVPPGRPVAEVYADTGPGAPSELRILPSSLPGAPAMVRPVIYPPKVFAVWVPEHLDLDRDLKIGAHWIYLKLRDSSWMPETIDREPEAQSEIPYETIDRLRQAFAGDRLGRPLVPYGSGAVERPAK